MKVKTLFLFAGLLMAATFTSTSLSAQDGKALIVNTTNAKEVAKLKAALKDVDSLAYRLTITEMKNGKAVTTVLGAAQASQVKKIRTDNRLTTVSPRLANGGMAASDIVIIVKNITKSGVVTDRVLKGLDTKLTKVNTVTLKGM